MVEETPARGQAADNTEAARPLRDRVGLSLRGIGALDAPALVETANRAGLITVGSVGPALTALKRLGDETQLRALLRFAVSDELGELRRAAGTSIG